VDVAAAQIDKLLESQLPQPKIEGRGTPTEIVRQSAGRFGEGLLNHVGWVDAGYHPRIHTHRDHSPQAIAMTGKQLTGRPTITIACAAQEFFDGGIIDARHPPISLPYNP
jgi:hypothetical protein